ncbi:MAG: double-strand break repair helicase AddA [Beijerinckiaceae bacterium]
MSGRPNIQPHISAAQHKASDPEASIWVSANAGSGKTHVLTERVMRLLLKGVPPGKILCLTFTKAAAANMAGRVFAILAKWTELDDAELAKAIEDIGAPRPQMEDLTLARRLFARAVETPGGLKIQTIHAFCERLLHLFPFEANVPARFEVIDDRSQAELLGRVRNETLHEARHDEGELGRALALLSEEISGLEFEGLIKTALHHREIFQAGTPLQTAKDLRAVLGLAPNQTVESLEAEMIEGGLMPHRWREFGAFFATSSKATDQDKAKSFIAAVEAYERFQQRAAAPDGCLPRVPAPCLADYLEIFFTKGGEGDLRKSLATKNLLAERSDLIQELFDEQVRLDHLRDLRKAAAAFERSYALAFIMHRLLAHYRRLKAARGLLDFEDLIHRTMALLERSDARWVLYKLDAGIDHILVDEAQDTSRAQWKILEDLTGEFAVGASSRTNRRSFFAVGDEKQSIFSFQGAAPDMFHAMRQKFQRSFSQGGKTFAHVQLTESFRSVSLILSTVDQVFFDAAHQKGLVTEDPWMRHSAALKRELPGLVEIWPRIGSTKQEDPHDWQLPVDALRQSDPASVLAKRIADKIAGLIAPNSRERVFDKDQGSFRPVRPGDILILVRTRNSFFDAIIRALKQNQVPVAGADRLQLTEHIAIMDLVAAARAALLPEDDLNLACVLKSPLIGLDDADLLVLAPKRSGSLIATLEAAADARHKAAATRLRTWQSRAALPPFAFYARLLGEDGGRRAMEARLGPEACDAMDEFLRLALEAEHKGILSLATFLSEFASIDLEIKRDMETLGDCIRVMTVHAAKGLEAKIVFLPDTCSAPNETLLPKLFALQEAANGDDVLVWSPRKDSDPSIVAAARAAALEAAKDEYRRLLYVALTRAEERLYVSGFHGASAPPEHCWSAMIERSLGEDFDQVQAFWSEDETILRRISPGHRYEDFRETGKTVSRSGIELPDFLRRPAPVETAPPPPLKPSSALAAAEAEFDPGRTALPHAALERGRLMHILLQYLPQVSVAGRRQAAQRFLDARAENLDDRGRAQLVDEALAVFDLPHTGELFGPKSRAEVAVAGRLCRDDGKVIEVAGQIDRIVETDAQVFVADFKTGCAYDENEVPRAFVTQMALYKAVLAQLWPDKRLVMLLIFTSGGKIVELPEGRLAAALSSLGISLAGAA